MIEKIEIRNLIKIQHQEIERNTIITNKETREWCLRPYLDHPKGCINYSKCISEETPFFDDIVKMLVLTKFFLIYADFNFAKYIENRRAINPKKSERQIKCLLYWQNSIKGMLRAEIIGIYNYNHLLNNPCKFYVMGCGSVEYLLGRKVYSMEALGINVFSTCKLNKIELERDPKEKIKLNCLICSDKQILFPKKE